jgi:hypothetical protein
MKKFSGILFILVVFCTSLLFDSCSTDFDINAEPKDITVVYGLLNQAETAQYIKITKAYLGDEDALVMAQNPENSSYGDNLSVSLEEWKNGIKNTTYYFSKTTITDKESGIFYFPNQDVYIANIPLLKNDCIYKLFITNNLTGKLISSETTLVNEALFKLKIPMTGANIGFVNNDGEYVASEVKWITAKNGRLYEPVFRFHYSDSNITTQVRDTTKYVDWILGSSKSNKLDGNEELSIAYDGESFFRILQGRIPLEPNLIKRRAIRVELIMSMGGDELSTYIDVNKPSSSIVQERPAYSNISNGIGIFSARYKKVYKFNLSPATRIALINNIYTQALDFE